MHLFCLLVSLLTLYTLYLIEIPTYTSVKLVVSKGKHFK